jgi:hypothetical protein
MTALNYIVETVFQIFSEPGVVFTSLFFFLAFFFNKPTPPPPPKYQLSVVDGGFPQLSESLSSNVPEVGVVFKLAIASVANLDPIVVEAISSLESYPLLTDNPTITYTLDHLRYYNYYISRDRMNYFLGAVDNLNYTFQGEITQ